MTNLDPLNSPDPDEDPKHTPSQSDGRTVDLGAHFLSTRIDQEVAFRIVYRLLWDEIEETVRCGPAKTFRHGERLAYVISRETGFDDFMTQFFHTSVQMFAELVEKDEDPQAKTSFTIPSWFGFNGDVDTTYCAFFSYDRGIADKFRSICRVTKAWKENDFEGYRRFDTMVEALVSEVILEWDKYKSQSNTFVDRNTQEVIAVYREKATKLYSELFDDHNKELLASVRQHLHYSY